jgi:uncharacterized Zn finger protein (UPF0148 family)
MYSKNDNYGADSTCVRCGAPIYFEVGPGTHICPSCGGDWSRTDNKIEEEERENLKYQEQMDKPEFWIRDMIERLDSEIWFYEMQFDGTVDIPYQAMEKAKWLVSKLKKIKQELMKSIDYEEKDDTINVIYL